MSASEFGVIDFEVDSEWSKCIYSDCSRGRDRKVPQCSRNNSSTDFRNYVAPKMEPELLSKSDPAARQKLESTLACDTHSISLSLCVRKHNFENYLWQFVHEGVFSGIKAYENLYLWTVLLKVRMHRRVPFGCLMRGLQSRLGLRSAEAFKFCLDGFYGMPGCGDIFGNHENGAVPWMEVSNQSTANSLHLIDGDIIFVSYANEKLESLARARKCSLMRVARGSIAAGSVLESRHNLAGGGAGSLRCHSALPLAGVAQSPRLHRAHELPSPRAQRALPAIHPGHPLCAAAESGASTHFCLAIVNPSESEFDHGCVDVSAVFTVDGSELLPDAMDRLLRLQSDLGDLFRVHYPGCGSGLGMAMSPDLLTRLLHAAESNSGPLVGSLRGLTESRVFKFDASLLEAGAAAGAAGAGGVGFVDELRRFALELDARLSVHCGDQPNVWRAVSANYFVVDTFFAAAVASVYGTGREHRFQPYTVDSAMLSIDESFAYTDIDPSAPCDHHLTRAWDLLHSLHPTTLELAMLEPSRYMRQLKDRFLQAKETWKNFVGYSVCSLYDDYNTKKAAFWAINYLVSHRSIYEHLLAEIEGAVGGKSGGTGPNEFRRLTLKDIEGMTFLEAFVKEVYRHTSGQFLRFRANASLMLQAQSLLGHKYRKGSQIAVLLRALNMNPRFFHNPEAFCPQRFLSSSQDAGQLCLPFGAMSLRRRIGLVKLKLFLILLLSRCSLSQQGPPAEINCRMYGMDVLPCVEDTNFQYKPIGSRAEFK